MPDITLPEQLAADGPILHGDGWEIVVGHGSLETTQERLIARELAQRYSAYTANLDRIAEQTRTIRELRKEVAEYRRQALARDLGTPVPTEEA